MFSKFSFRDPLAWTLAQTTKMAKSGPIRWFTLHQQSLSNTWSSINIYELKVLISIYIYWIFRVYPITEHHESMILFFRCNFEQVSRYFYHHIISLHPASFKRLALIFGHSYHIYMPPLQEAVQFQQLIFFLLLLGEWFQFKLQVKESVQDPVQISLKRRKVWYRVQPPPTAQLNAAKAMFCQHSVDHFRHVLLTCW